MIQDIFASKKEVEVRAFDGLLVDFARAQGTRVVIRGLRAVSDFEYEFQMALMNRSLAPDIETFFMMPSVNYTFLSSNMVREIAGLGGSVEGLVPGPVVRKLRNKFHGSKKVQIP
jgi:pantetheine-phosphate adenylyltransferase